MIIWGECTWIYKANIERVMDGWVVVYNNEMNKGREVCDMVLG